MIYFLIVISSFPISLIVIYFSNRSKNTTFIWFGRLCPPMAILILATVPFDLMTTLFWLIGGGVMVFSVLRIIYFSLELITKLIRKTIKKTKDQQDLKFNKTIRPALCILFFFISSKLVSMSIYSANAKALELAFETNEYVKKNKTCQKKELTPATKFQTFRYGDYGTQYVVSYYCEPEQKRFTYRVRINIDESFSVIGDFDGAMKVILGYASNEVVINDNVDLEALANRKIRYNNDKKQ